MISRPIPDPEPWTCSAPRGPIAALDAATEAGTGVIFVDAPPSERLAVAAHVARRAERRGAVVCQAFAPLDPEPWLELALQSGVAPTDACSTARGIAESSASVLVVVEAESVSRWGEAVCAELTRLRRPGTLVVVLTSRPAAVARQLHWEVPGSDDRARFFDALVDEGRARASTFDRLSDLEAWWRRRGHRRVASTDDVETLLGRLSLLRRSASRALAVELGGDEALGALVARGDVVVTAGRVRVTRVDAALADDAAWVADVLLRHERDAWAIMRAAELRGVAGGSDWRAAVEAVRAAPDAAARADMWLRLESLFGGDERLPLAEVARIALECGDSEQALRLSQRASERGLRSFAVAMVMARAMRARGDLTAAAVALSRAAELVESEAQRADIEVEWAEQGLARGDLALAREHASAALHGEVEVRLSARNVLGKVLLSEGLWAEAEMHFAADEQAAREGSLSSERLRARLNRAIAVMSAGRRSEARTLLTSVLEEGERTSDRRARAFALANLSTFATDAHEYGEAIELLERAIDDVRALGDQPRLSRLIANLAELRLRVGMLEEAEQALAFARQACGPTPGGPTASLLGFVSAHARLLRGHTLQAAAEIDDAIRAADTSSNGGKLSQCCRLATRIALEDGDVVRAARYLERAREAGPYLDSAVDIALLGAMIEQAAGRPFVDVAIEALERAQEASDVELTRQAHVLCHLALREHDGARARRHLENALRLRDHLAGALPESLRAGYLARRDLALLGKLELEAVEAPSVPATLPPPRDAAPAPTLERAMARLVGETEAMQSLRGAIAKVGRSEATVLIHGESGTGKELVADAIHAASGRASGPLVKINCAAIVETLLLSELFGHERGAFTGAHAKRRGRFEQADGGTIFLDEIGDISPNTQVALLRVLQEKTFERVGGITPVQVDVRVVCATHRDLAQMVADGTFREDLYYRLCGVTLETPALRDRVTDLRPLCESLLDRIAQGQGQPVKRLSPEALEALGRHGWPGNVRELENVLRAASLFADGRVIQLEDITDNVSTLEYLAARVVPPISQTRARVADPGDVVFAEIVDGKSLPEMKRALERACIERALAETDGNITKAAELLGMKRPRLSQLVNQYAREDGKEVAS